MVTVARGEDPLSPVASSDPNCYRALCDSTSSAMAYGCVAMVEMTARGPLGIVGTDDAITLASANVLSDTCRGLAKPLHPHEASLPGTEYVTRAASASTLYGQQKKLPIIHTLFIGMQIS